MWCLMTCGTGSVQDAPGRLSPATDCFERLSRDLAALIKMYNTLGVLRQRLPASSHIQGIITRGGEATNIVPDLAEGRFGLRGLTTAALYSLVDQVTGIAENMAAATGSTVQIQQARAPYAHFRPNDVLTARFSEHLAAAGIATTPPDPGVFLGSSDIGNVSTALPAIHPFVAIMDSDQSDHTPQFAAAAASPRVTRAAAISNSNASAAGANQP